MGRKTVITTICTVSLLCACIFNGYSGRAADTNGGGNVTACLGVESSEPVYAMQAYVQYDPQKLEFVEMEPQLWIYDSLKTDHLGNGTVYQKNAAAGIFCAEVVEPGTVLVIMTSLGQTGGESGAGGDLTAAKLTFQKLAEDAAQSDFTGIGGVKVLTSYQSGTSGEVNGASAVLTQITGMGEGGAE